MELKDQSNFCLYSRKHEKKSDVMTDVVDSLSSILRRKIYANHHYLVHTTTAFFSKRLDYSSNGGYENVICVVVVRIWFCWLPPGRNVEGRHHT